MNHTSNPAAKAMPVVRRLLEALGEVGYFPTSFNDGGEDDEPCVTKQKAIEAIFSVEFCTVTFDHLIWREGLISFIPENGWDVICDHTCASWLFEETIDRVIEDVDREREKLHAQPT